MLSEDDSAAAGADGTQQEPPATAASQSTSPATSNIEQLSNSLPEHSKVESRSWRSRLASFTLAPQLPRYTGPYAVGCHDIEWYGGSGRAHRGSAMSSRETATLTEDIDAETRGEQQPVLVRLYYPAKPSGTEQHSAWLPPPAYTYGQGKYGYRRADSSLLYGYGDFARLPRFVSVPLMAATVMFTKLPAYLDAPVARERPKAQLSSTSSPFGRFPVVMFSHGLGGCRTTYSGICGELASHGFVVCAVEHRDGTASVTSVERGRRTLTYRRLKKDEDEYRLRREQIHHRLGEIHSAWELLERLNAGDAVANCLELLPEQPAEGAPDQRFTQAQLRDRLDLERAVMAGHSFGAVTTMEALQEPSHPYRCGLALDAWMFPLARDAGDASSSESVHKPTPPPILAINSQVFTEWSDNYSALRERLIRWNDAQRAHDDARWPQLQSDDSAGTGSYGPSWLLTVRNSAHQNQSDLPILFDWMLRFSSKLSGKMDPVYALSLNNRVCLEFLRRLLSTGNPDDPLMIRMDNDALATNTANRPAELFLHRLDEQADVDEVSML